MKVIDMRDNRAMAGDLVHTIPAGERVSEEHMRQFYKSVPGDTNYTVLSAPMDKDRVVLRRGDSLDDTEVSYYIVPLYQFYKVEE